MCTKNDKILDNSKISFSSAEAIRNINRKQILEIIRSSSPIALTELVDCATLSRSTVTSILNEMREVGLVLNAGFADSTGGRRPTLLEYHPETIKAIGVSCFGENIYATLTDFEGCPIQHLKKTRSGASSEQLLHLIAELVEELLEREDKKYIVGVGVGMPGIVNVDEGVIIEHVGHGYKLKKPIAVKKILESRLNIPVKIANRSRTAALGEHRAGVGQGVKNLLYVFLGRGIVVGMIINGEIFFGSGFSAGEIGHNSVNPTGPLCGCGNRGCLEVFATEKAIIAHAIEKAKVTPDSLLNGVVNNNLRLLTLEIIINCAQKGDSAALQLIDETGRYIGLALSSAINLLNPDMIVIGGPIGTIAGNLLLPSIYQEIQCRSLSLPLQNLKIMISSNDAAEVSTIGAACLILDDNAIKQVFNILANP